MPVWPNISGIGLGFGCGLIGREWYRNIFDRFHHDDFLLIRFLACDSVRISNSIAIEEPIVKRSVDYSVDLKRENLRRISVPQYLTKQQARILEWASTSIPKSAFKGLWVLFVRNDDEEPTHFVDDSSVNDVEKGLTNKHSSVRTENSVIRAISLPICMLDVVFSRMHHQLDACDSVSA